MGGGGGRHVRDRVTWIAGALALAVSVLALGGVPRWALGAAAVLAAIAVAAQLPSRRALTQLSPLMAVLVLLVGLTALQAVPLPAGLSAALAPTTAELIADSQRLATGEAPTWRALTVDAPGTWRELLLAVLLVATAFVALRLAAHERGRYRLQAAVGAACALTALIVGVHQVLGAESLYGVYTPRQAGDRLLGPLLNPNHLASLMVVGALTCLGLALHARQRQVLRALWLLASLGCVAVVLASRSRGAVIALGAGAVVGVAAFLLQRRGAAEEQRGRAPLWTSLPLAAVVVCAFALVVSFGGADVAKDLEDTSASELADPRSKFAAWRASEELVRESPWVGVGHGGFEPAFTRVFPASSGGTFSHVENMYVQAVVDFGVPGAIALAGALAWLALAMLRRVRSGPLAAGGLAALVGVAVHSTVDFALELPGLAVPAVILAATLAYVPLRPTQDGPRRRGVAARIALVGACVGGALLVVPAWGRTVAEDHEQLSAAPPALAVALDALRRHPLDYYAAGQAAMAAAREGDDPRAIKLLNHALALHPTHVGLHREAARLLRRAGKREQAALEYSIAVRGSPAPGVLLDEIVAVFRDDATALRALPLDHRNPFLIGRHLIERERPGLAADYYQRIVERQPARLDVADALLQLAGRLRRADVVERVATDLLRRQPTLARRLALARALSARGAAAETAALLEGVDRATGARGDRLEAWRLRCDALIASAEIEHAQGCLIGLMSSELVAEKQRAALGATLRSLRSPASALMGSGAPPPTPSPVPPPPTPR